MPSGEPKATFESPDSSVNSVAFSADGNTLVLGCHDRTVKLWEFATGATRTVGVHLGPVNAVAFFPQGDLLASASGDGTVKLWHASPPQDSVGFARKSAIRSLAFTPDSKLLVVGSDHPTAGGGRGDREGNDNPAGRRRGGGLGGREPAGGVGGR